MSITNDRRDSRRERLHLPLQVLWQEEQSKQSSAWMLDVNPSGLLLELSSMTNLSDDNLVRVAFHLDEKRNYELGDGIVRHTVCRDGRQLLGIELKKENPFLFCPAMLGFSPQVIDIKSSLALIVCTGLNILISGETGTGKNVLAKMIHDLCKGTQAPFIRVNCPSIPDSLFESELFGHEKGAYTDAKSAAPGYFRLASGGTILLDEISEIKPHLQAKLLRVIEDKNFMPVGGHKLIPVRANIIATTNLDLEKAVQEGSFRRDLFYRLCEMPIHLPPLRERMEDVVLLAYHYLLYYCAYYRRPFRTLSANEVDLLENYSWPGNIRELENFMKQSAVLDKFIGPKPALPQSSSLDMSGLEALGLSQEILDGHGNLTELTKKMTKQIELSIIASMMRECDDNRVRAAARLGISYRTLLRKLA